MPVALVCMLRVLLCHALPCCAALILAAALLQPVTASENCLPVADAICQAAQDGVLSTIKILSAGRWCQATGLNTKAVQAASYAGTV